MNGSPTEAQRKLRTALHRHHPTLDLSYVVLLIDHPFFLCASHSPSPPHLFLFLLLLSISSLMHAPSSYLERVLASDYEEEPFLSPCVQGASELRVALLRSLCRRCGTCFRPSSWSSSLLFLSFVNSRREMQIRYVSSLRCLMASACGTSSPPPTPPPSPPHLFLFSYMMKRFVAGNETLRSVLRAFDLNSCSLFEEVHSRRLGTGI